jgi:hypothetical protein
MDEVVHHDRLGGRRQVVDGTAVQAGAGGGVLDDGLDGYGFHLTELTVYTGRVEEGLHGFG